MVTNKKFNIKSIATFIIVAMFFSCQDNMRQVQQMAQSELIPKIEETDMNLIYTDSGKVAARLLSPKMLDFTDQKFPFREFPSGIKVIFYDQDSGKENTVIANYAIQYEKTNLIDLQGDVEIVTSDSTILNSKQLFWDQDEEWLFTDLDYTIKMNNGTTNNGLGFDAKQDFNNFISRSNTGTHHIEDKEQ